MGRLVRLVRLRVRSAAGIQAGLFSLTFAYALATLALKWAIAPRYGVDTSVFGPGDCVGVLLMGQEPHRVSVGSLYFPALEWVLLCSLCGVPAVAAAVLRPSGLQEQAVLRGGSRGAWSLSGAVWALMATCSWWISLLTAAAVWSVARGLSLDPSLHQEVMLFLLGDEQLVAWGPQMGIKFFAGSFLASVAVGQLVRLVAEVWGAAVATAAPVALMIVSDYAQEPFLVGNLMALGRFEDAVPGGLPWISAVAWAAMLGLACIVAAYVHDQRTDLLGEGES